MTRAPTLPLDDKGMWRRLLARVHPNAGGDHELFIWTGAVRELACNSTLPAGVHSSRRREGSTYEEPARVPFDPSVDFSELTRRALAMGEEVGGTYGTLLELLEDCEEPLMQTGAW